MPLGLAAGASREEAVAAVGRVMGLTSFFKPAQFSSIQEELLRIDEVRVGAGEGGGGGGWLCAEVAYGASDCLPPSSLLQSPLVWLPPSCVCCVLPCPPLFCVANSARHSMVVGTVGAVAH